MSLHRIGENFVIPECLYRESTLHRRNVHDWIPALAGMTASLGVSQQSLFGVIFFWLTVGIRFDEIGLFKRCSIPSTTTPKTITKGIHVYDNQSNERKIHYCIHV